MISLLDPIDPNRFPDPETAEQEPNGLLAVGGDLRPERLLNAYRRGIFPWYGADQPILWWSPNPRLVLLPKRFHCSRSLRKALRASGYSISFDRAFERVIDACAAPRADQPGTWITPEMRDAYLRLHHQGQAHSVEVWAGHELLGGLYGIAIGRVFFGESMFSRRPNASKMALAGLLRLLDHWRFQLIDCQVYTEHLVSLGAEEIPRSEFLRLLQRWCPSQTPEGPWHAIEPLPVALLAGQVQP